MNAIAAVLQIYSDFISQDLPQQYSKISEMENIFSGQPPWSDVKRSGLSSRGTRKMNMLGTAKVLADEFATLSFSEQVEITLDDENAEEYVKNALELNGFYKNMPAFLSSAYALGGGVIKVFADNRQPCLDFVSADNFIPTAWNGKGIFEGIFTSSTAKGKSFYTLVERHSRNNGIYEIENRLFRSNYESELGNEVSLEELYSDLQPNFSYDSDKQMFSYFKLAIANNFFSGSQLGISVFANSIDTLKALDIAFDSFSREFVLGKKRIIVPSSCVRTIVNPDTGESTRYFDADDEAYVALKCDEERDLKITDNTIELRVEEHVSAINALLNLLCFQTGLSAGTLSFSSAEGVKTATEIISRDSKTARTIKSNKNLLVELLEDVVLAIIEIGIYYDELPRKDYAVTIGFQDNIIIDDDTLIDRNIKLVSAGLKSKVSAIMEILKCDEETAKKEIDKINAEQDVSSLAVEDFMSNE